MKALGIVLGVVLAALLMGGALLLLVGRGIEREAAVGPLEPKPGLVFIDEQLRSVLAIVAVEAPASVKAGAPFDVTAHYVATAYMLDHKDLQVTVELVIDSGVVATTTEPWNEGYFLVAARQRAAQTFRLDVPAGVKGQGTLVLRATDVGPEPLVGRMVLRGDDEVELAQVDVVP